jgi:hypothetical protein
LLAARRDILPNDWNWTEFYKVAAKFVCFAFEKSDAKERWGSENVFQVLTGGRSLRATGEDIYNSAINEFVDSKEATKARKDAVNPSNKVFLEVGGEEVWKQFVRDLSNTFNTRR